MQQKLADTERRCAMLAAQTSGQGSTGPAAADTFVSRLLDIVADLYQQEQYRWLSSPQEWISCFSKVVLCVQWSVWVTRLLCFMFSLAGVCLSGKYYHVTGLWSICDMKYVCILLFVSAVIWMWKWSGRRSVPISLCWLLVVMFGVWPTWPPPLNWTWLVSKPAVTSLCFKGV